MLCEGVDSVWCSVSCIVAFLLGPQGVPEAGPCFIFYVLVNLSFLNVLWVTVNV